MTAYVNAELEQQKEADKCHSRREWTTGKVPDPSTFEWCLLTAALAMSVLRRTRPNRSLPGRGPPHLRAVAQEADGAKQEVPTREVSDRTSWLVTTSAS